MKKFSWLSVLLTFLAIHPEVVGVNINCLMIDTSGYYDLSPFRELSKRKGASNDFYFSTTGEGSVPVALQLCTEVEYSGDGCNGALPESKGRVIDISTGKDKACKALITKDVKLTIDSNSIVFI